jgi:hypothetical protein
MKTPKIEKEIEEAVKQMEKVCYSLLEQNKQSLTQFAEKIKVLINNYISNKEELRVAKRQHKDMGKYGEGYVDCYEQTNDTFIELKQEIDNLLKEELKQ